MNKKTAILCIALILLLLTATAVSAATKRTVKEEKPGVAKQFLNSLLCIFTQCGWPAIIIFILPPVAIFVYKKFFSWG